MHADNHPAQNTDQQRDPGLKHTEILNIPHSARDLKMKYKYKLNINLWNATLKKNVQ